MSIMIAQPETSVRLQSAQMMHVCDQRVVIAKRAKLDFAHTDSCGSVRSSDENLYRQNQSLQS